MSNKKLGTKFERDYLKRLADNEWWAHFLNPDASGAQPFDILALRGSETMAIDCKTCASNRFPLSRIEDNQFWAFRSIIWKCDAYCGIAVLHNNEIYLIPFEHILSAQRRNESSIELKEEYRLNERNRVERYKN